MVVVSYHGSRVGELRLTLWGSEKNVSDPVSRERGARTLRPVKESQQFRERRKEAMREG